MMEVLIGLTFSAILLIIGVAFLILIRAAMQQGNDEDRK